MRKKFAKIFSVALAGLIFAIGVRATTDDFSRKGAKAQNSDLWLPGGSAFAPLRLCVRSFVQEPYHLVLEVFQVLELPLNVHEASLVKAEKGYFLKISLANSADSKMIGFRYSLVAVDSRNQARSIVNRIEGVSMPAYATKSLTFKTPIRFKVKDDERLVLMLEQVISRESIWEVVKAKDALDAFAKGDYSVVPVVLRVPNQVDAPPVTPRIFKR